MSTSNNALQAFEKLVKIIQELREKCPWDQQQTMESLRHLVIEETFELSEAILAHDAQAIKKELGDVFSMLLFYTQIATEKSMFTTSDMIHAICDKLIYRHPHVYGETKAKDIKTVRKNWEQLKFEEDKNHTVLKGVPSSLPTLIKAMRIREKASMAGFDWKQTDKIWHQIQEEVNELYEAVHQPNTHQNKQAHIEEELGDLLFIAKYLVLCVKQVYICLF